MHMAMPMPMPMPLRITGRQVPNGCDEAAAAVIASKGLHELALGLQHERSIDQSINMGSESEADNVQSKMIWPSTAYCLRLLCGGEWLKRYM